MVCGAKRVRSLYLPWITGVTSELSTKALPKGLASLSTINAATMRLCRADLPASVHSSCSRRRPGPCNGQCRLGGENPPTPAVFPGTVRRGRAG